MTKKAATPLHEPSPVVREDGPSSFVTRIRHVRSVPQVSVVIATHNRPHLLPRAVASARAAGANVEIVVVDDASTDETARVCRDLSNVVYVRAERNQRVAAARNLGIMASSADCISFLDDDDVRMPQSLDIQLQALFSNPEAGFVYGQALVSDQGGKTDGTFYPEPCPQGDIFWQLLERNFIPCGSAVFRKSCLYSIGLLAESIPGVDDWDLWIRLAELYEAVAVECPVIIWRRSTPTSGQGSSETVSLISLSGNLLRNRWLALPRAASAAARDRREAWRNFSTNVSDHLFWQTGSAFVRGDLQYATKSAVTGLRLHPAATLGAARRWSRVSALRILLNNGLTNEGLMSAEAQFKQARGKRSK